MSQHTVLLGSIVLTSSQLDQKQMKLDTFCVAVKQWHFFNAAVKGMSHALICILNLSPFTGVHLHSSLVIALYTGQIARWMIRGHSRKVGGGRIV